MGMLQEFRTFAVKGNAVDIAVGVVIGAAFGKIVTSLVEDVIMPPLGMLMGGRDFTNLFITLDGSEFDSLVAAKEAGAAIIGYGSFVQTSINFIIVALAVFIMVKAINKASASAAKEAEEADSVPVEPAEDVLLLREIRDSLAASVGKLAATHEVIAAVAAKVPEPGSMAAAPAAASVEAVAESGSEAAAPAESAAEQDSADEPAADGATEEEPKKAAPKPAEDDGLGWIDD